MPKTEEERKKSRALIDVFIGRKKTAVKRSNEVPQIKEGGNIELGTIHKSADGDNDAVKGSENPMRSLNKKTRP